MYPINLIDEMKSHNNHTTLTGEALDLYENVRANLTEDELVEWLYETAGTKSFLKEAEEEIRLLTEISSRTSTRRRVVEMIEQGGSYCLARRFLRDDRQKVRFFNTLAQNRIPQRQIAEIQTMIDTQTRIILDDASHDLAATRLGLC